METSNYFKAQIFGKRRNKKKKCKAGKTRRVRGSKTKTRTKGGPGIPGMADTGECPAGYAIYGGAKRSYT